ITWDSREQRIAVRRHPQVDVADLAGRVDSGVDAYCGKHVHGLDAVRMSLGNGVVVQVLVLAELGEPREWILDRKPRSEAQHFLHHPSPPKWTRCTSDAEQHLLDRRPSLKRSSRIR